VTSLGRSRRPRRPPTPAEPGEAAAIGGLLPGPGAALLRTACSRWRTKGPAAGAAARSRCALLVFW